MYPRARLIGPLAVCAAACLWGALTLAADPPAETLRKYTDGPLVAADFVMPVPKPLPKKGSLTMWAQTFVEIRYNYRYRTEAAGARRKAILTSANFFTTLAREKSWNAYPKNLWLMAHEQGHFDLGEIYRGRAQAKFDKAAADGSLSAIGDTEEAAIKALGVVFDVEFQKVIDDMNADHRRYDVDTQHGVEKGRQQEWRRKLDEHLKEAGG